MPLTATTPGQVQRPSAAEPAASRRAASPRRLALAGGGTGGHIVPGLHLLAAIPAAEVPDDIVWFTSGRPVEERVLGAAGTLLDRQTFERVALALEPPRHGAPSRSRLVLRTPAAVVRARAQLVRHRSEIVVGLGGFTSLPVVLAARSLRIPVVLLEVNAHLGAATRWLGRFATRTLHAWRATLPAGEDERNRFVGPPLGPDFALQARLSDTERRERATRARRALGFAPDRPLLVVLGGSQGSGALNRFVREHAIAFGAAGISVLHQTGPGKLGEAAPDHSLLRAVEYVTDVHTALAGATVALVRGGASTLSEVAAMRVPCFVAPYPGHADRHQERNAAELGAGARIVPDSRLNAAARDEILALALDGGAAERSAMSRALAESIPVDGAERIWAALAGLGRTQGRTK